MPELKEMLDSYDLKKLTKVNSHKNLKTHKSSVEVDTIVCTLLDHYKAPEFIPLFRKAAWYLSESTLAGFIEKGADKDSPLAYFAACSRNALSKL